MSPSRPRVKLLVKLFKHEVVLTVLVVNKLFEAIRHLVDLLVSGVDSRACHWPLSVVVLGKYRVSYSLRLSTSAWPTLA